VPLLERDTRAVRLTPAGRRRSAKFGRLLQRFDQGIARVVAAQTQARRKLRIGVLWWADLTGFAPFERALARASGVRVVEPVVGQSAELMTQLRRGEIAATMLVLPYRTEGLQLHRSPACRTWHWFRRRTRWPAGARCACATSRRCRPSCAFAGATTRSCTTTSRRCTAPAASAAARGHAQGTVATLSQIAAGRGCTVLPRTAARRSHPGVAARRLLDEIYVDVALAAPDDLQPSLQEALRRAAPSLAKAVAEPRAGPQCAARRRRDGQSRPSRVRAPFSDQTAMSSSAFASSSRGAAALTLLREADVPQWLRSAGAQHRRWLQGSGFRGRAGELALLPGEASPEAVFVFAGDGSSADFWRLAGLPLRLPEGAWQWWRPVARHRRAAGAGLGHRRLPVHPLSPGRARSGVSGVAAPRRPRGGGARGRRRGAGARPHQHAGAGHGADRAGALGGDDGAPARHELARGGRRGAAEEWLRADPRGGPCGGRCARLIDLTWGEAKHPKVTLVGKGVCFDTGGLDIKGADGMKLMKKDMGGAAHALALAQTIVGAKLPVRLRVLVPAVENAIAGNALRPLDVITRRRG